MSYSRWQALGNVYLLTAEPGFTAERVERLGDFYASPGMLSESFTLVRAHGLRKVGSGGGDEHEDINVHLVAREDIPNFLEQKRVKRLDQGSSAK